MESEGTSTVDLLSHSCSSAVPLVDDLGKNGERGLPGFSDESQRIKQYIEAMHLTISSEILQGHW